MCSASQVTTDDMSREVTKALGAPRRPGEETQLNRIKGAMNATMPASIFVLSDKHVLFCRLVPSPADILACADTPAHILG